jgi:hypothetical protein
VRRISHTARISEKCAAQLQSECDNIAGDADARWEDIHENLRFPDASIDDHKCEAPASLLADATSPLPVGRPRLGFAQLLSPAGEVQLVQAAPHRVRLLHCLPACALFDRTLSTVGPSRTAW